MPTLLGNVSHSHMKHVVCTLHLTDICHIVYVPPELKLHIAAVGTAWSLLGAPRNGQAALYLFQKIYSCGSTLIAHQVTVDVCDAGRKRM